MARSPPKTAPGVHHGSCHIAKLICRRDWTVTASPTHGPAVTNGNQSNSGTRATLLLSGLYVAQTIPPLLVGTAIPPILRQQGVSLATIGALGLLLVPWTLKFLWAPLVDRFGARRAWILGGQGTVLAMLGLLAMIDPAGPAWHLFLPLGILSLASATQDVAVDAHAVELLPPERHATGGALQSGAGAAGLVVGGAVALFVYDHAGWAAAILTTAALSALAVSQILWPGSTAAPVASVRRRPSLRRFLGRGWALPLLVLGVLFRLPDGVLAASARPYLVDEGFTLSRIGTLYGLTGAVFGLAIIPLAARLLRRAGPIRFLFGVVALRGAIHLGFAGSAAGLLPGEGPATWLAMAHALSGYVEVTALYALFLRGSSVTQAATDFSLLSGGAALSFAAGSVLAGLVAESAGYAAAFATGAAVCLLGGGAAVTWIGRQERFAALD